MKHIIYGNYGDATIALIQWTYENNIQDVTVCHMQTGSASSRLEWQQQIDQGQALAKRYGFEVKTLSSVYTFSELVLKKKAFPSAQFQWCAPWLKGVALLEWLDDIDAACQATLLLPKHTVYSHQDIIVHEREPHSPHFGERQVWHPLYNISAEDFYALIQRAEFTPLYHRSLECAPCIHSTVPDLTRLTEIDQDRVAVLEQQLATNLFAKEAYGDTQGIRRVVEWAKTQSEKEQGQPYQVGCGTPFACGD